MLARIKVVYVGDFMSYLDKGLNTHPSLTYTPSDVFEVVHIRKKQDCQIALDSQHSARSVIEDPRVCSPP